MKAAVVLAWLWGLAGWIYGIGGWHCAQKEQARAAAAEAWAETVEEEAGLWVAERTR